MKGFAGADPPEAWPRLRGSPLPERLDAGLDTLPGVGPKIASRLKRLGLRGQLRRNEFAVRSYDLDGATSTADLAPIYPAGEEITPPRMRALVAAALTRARDYLDFLPASLKTREALPTRADALVALHRPRTPEEAESGRQRLAFDELLLLQL